MWEALKDGSLEVEEKISGQRSNQWLEIDFHFQRNQVITRFLENIVQGRPGLN